MPKVHRVRLTDPERAFLRDEVAAGAAPARRLAHARVLLKADEGAAGPAWADARIAEALAVSVATVERVRQRYVAEGLDAALSRRRPHPAPRRKLDGHQEAHLIALACSAPPAGHERWSLRLLAERFVVLAVGEPVSHELVRRTLKKTTSSRGCRSSGASRHGPTPNSSGAWRTRWRPTPGPTTRASPRSAWTN